MAHLIVGHVTDTTARIWIRGDKRHTVGEVQLQSAGGSPAPQRVALTAGKDFTGTADFGGLHPATQYTVTVSFPGCPPQVTGGLCTMPASSPGKPANFSFVLSSCNLSVVSINNLLAYLVAIAGTSVARFSLDLPLERWKFPRTRWMRAPLRSVTKLLLFGSAKLVKTTTGVKQPGPPQLRSPFLKLAAVFDSVLLEVAAEEKDMPKVGEVVRSSDARGIVACLPSKAPGKPATAAVEDRKNRNQKGATATWRLVVTQVTGAFQPDQQLYAQSSSESGDDKQLIGPIVSAAAGPGWYSRPAFFIHAGDQIYYDFPEEDRRPDADEYRLAYREAWFDDDANRHLLAHWPHYMTLDDHEIADQFARDFHPPAAGVKPGFYLHEANAAYHDYVQSRQPNRTPDRDAGESWPQPLWYRFDPAGTRFFVLDTRTQRYNGAPGAFDGRIIDEDQEQRLIQWMKCYKSDLKFVVSSVPFVAEIRDGESADQGWFARSASARQDKRRRRDDADVNPVKAVNPANDKWCAKRFEAQRNRIIKAIYDNNIERLVFLTGDMHCCYHAIMRIGKGPKYESSTVHELAGGPVNQLQLARVDDFVPRHAASLDDELRYEVELESFHTQVNAVMHLGITHVDREQVPGGTPSPTPEVEWNVIRTLTETEANDWWPDGIRHHQPAEKVMSGRISFVTKRTPRELALWP